MKRSKQTGTGTIISLRVPKSLKSWLQVYAARKGRSLSNLVVYILTQFKEQVEQTEKKEKKTEEKQIIIEG